MPNINLQPRSAFLVTDVQTGRTQEYASFTCCHCNRVVACHPERKRPRNICRKCMALTCDSAGCVVECNPILKDVDRSLGDRHGQPWMLRGLGVTVADHGFPVDRIFGPNGKELLVLRKDNGSEANS